MYREPVSVASLDWPVTVLTYQQVLQRYPGLTGAEALQAYEDDHRAEVEEGDNASGKAGMDGMYIHGIESLGGHRVHKQGMCLS